MTDYRAHLRQRLVENAVPDTLHDGLVEYCAARRPVGSFLTAVLANDLTDAVCRADERNFRRLKDLCRFLFNYCPAPAWGSREKVAAWLADPEPVPEIFE